MDNTARCADSKGKGMQASQQVSLRWAQEVRRKRRSRRKRGKRGKSEGRGGERKGVFD